MRGTRLLRKESEHLERFIPAYAGNTPVISSSANSSSVHPRVCGEHAIRLSGFAPSCGSSPRMRGTLYKTISDEGTERFIPAYAGNTVTKSNQKLPVPVHPRVCGEHGHEIEPEAAGAGSSPRMRGTRQTNHSKQSIDRFIPAYAGNTPHAGRTFRPYPVHPRVCGEHDWKLREMKRSLGSSPRMRGTLKVSDLNETGNRFIPAYAGNTLQRHFGVIVMSVHPRVCGEHQPRLG